MDKELQFPDTIQTQAAAALALPAAQFLGLLYEPVLA
jgi:hypothetical protein